MAVKCPKCQSENTDTARYFSNCAASLQPSEKASSIQTKTLETHKLSDRKKSQENIKYPSQPETDTEDQPEAGQIEDKVPFPL